MSDIVPRMDLRGKLFVSVLSIEHDRVELKLDVRDDLGAVMLYWPSQWLVKGTGIGLMEVGIPISATDIDGRPVPWVETDTALTAPPAALQAKEVP